MQAQTKMAELTQLPENEINELNLACFTHLLADLATVVKCEVIPRHLYLGPRHCVVRISLHEGFCNLKTRIRVDCSSRICTVVAAFVLVVTLAYHFSIVSGWWLFLKVKLH